MDFFMTSVIRADFHCCMFGLTLLGVSCHQMPAHRRSSTRSVCLQVWVLPASSKPPSTAPWTSWPRPSTPAPITPRPWLPATLTPCVLTPSPKGSLSPTLYPHLHHRHLQMTQTLASKMDCGTLQLPLQPRSMVSSSHKATTFICATHLNMCRFKYIIVQGEVIVGPWDFLGKSFASFDQLGPLKIWLSAG